jgi:hypothetical protein
MIERSVLAGESQKRPVGIPPRCFAEASQGRLAQFWQGPTERILLTPMCLEVNRNGQSPLNCVRLPEHAYDKFLEGRVIGKAMACKSNILSTIIP